MSIQDIRKQYVKVLSASLNKKSKFYQEDLDGIKKAASTKNKAQLMEAIGRWNAISNVSQSMINANCQFGGLNKLGK